LVQLNTVIRPPAMPGVAALSPERLAEVAAGLGLPCEVSAPPTAQAGTGRGEADHEVVEMTRRRPCTLDDIVAAAGLDREGAERLVHELARQGKLKTEEHQGQIYYRGV